MSTGLNDRDACLALAERSPAAVAVHDKAAWLALFTRYNIVEDPVGSRPHLSGTQDRRGGSGDDGPLGRFYDTFIAPNRIRFEVVRDVVCGPIVVRDLTIEIEMAPRVTVRTPMHLLYELREEGGELRIFRLAAHWELLPALRQQMAAGVDGLGPGLAAGWRMLRYLGIGGTWGFLGALRSIGRAGKERVERFARYFNRGEGQALRLMFVEPHCRIAFPVNRRTLTVEQILERGGELRFDKLISAGNCVSATVHYATAERSHSGVAFFEFDTRSLRLVSLAMYWEE
jgi:hypothetical protein